MQSVTVVGSGTGLDEVTLINHPEINIFQLHLSDLYSFGINLGPPVEVPSPATGQGTISVEPASVPQPGVYLFTVRGQGFDPNTQLFLTVCRESVSPETCDLANLMPVDLGESFETQVTYEVFEDGLIITASDPTASQSASAFIIIDAEAELADSLGPPLHPAIVMEAEELIWQFIDTVRGGGASAALPLWTGYPAGDNEKSSTLATFTQDFAWMFESGTATRASALPSWSFGEPTPVVTVTSLGPDGSIAHAASFVLSFPTDGEQLRIERLPEAPDPLPDTSIGSGEDTIVLDGVPTEGGARVFLDYVEGQVIVDHDDFTTTIIIPASAPNKFVLTLVTSTPEVPAVRTLVVHRE